MKRFNLMGNAQIPPAPSSGRSSGSSFGDLQNLLVAVPIIIAIGIVFIMHTKSETINKSLNPILLSKLKSLSQTYNDISSSVMTNGSAADLLKQKQILTDRLERIKEADSLKMQTVNMLITIRESMSEKITVTSLDKKDLQLVIEGIAQDNESLSAFIESLEKKQNIKNLRLKRAQFSDEFGPYKQKFVIEGEL